MSTTAVKHRTKRVADAAAPAVKPAAKQQARQPDPGMCKRLRKHAVPHGVVAGLALAASCARIAEVASGETATVALTIATATVVLTIAAYMVAKNRTASSIVRKVVTALTATGGVWLAVVAAAGWSWEAAAVLVCTGYGAALPHWRRHRIPNPGKPRASAKPASEFASPYPLRWRHNIATTDGALPKSSLLDESREKHAWAYTVKLKPGAHDTGSVLAAIPRIASGLEDIAVEDVIVEKHPTRHASLALLKIITESPIKNKLPFTGPRFDDARNLLLGLYADGLGEAAWRLYSENSMWGGVIIGAPGAGKSRLAEQIAVCAAELGDTAVLWADPQHGASSPALTQHAAWSATDIDEILEQLRAAERITAWRAKENAARSLSGFTPSPERPGILVIIDECHKVFANDEARRRAGYIAREGRKVGVTILAMSQYPGLETFGNDNALRSCLMAGNAIVMRTASKTDKGIIPGLELDPYELPRMPGYAYTLVDGDGNGRTAPFRTYYIPDNKDIEKGRAPEGTPTVADWLARYPQVLLDAVAANGAGIAYLERHERAAAARQAALEDLAAMENGTYQQPTSPLAADLAEAPNGIGLDNVIVFPTLAECAPAPTSNSKSLRDKHHEVLAAIDAGNTELREIWPATKYQERHVLNILKELVAMGILTKSGHGQYTRTTHTQAA